MNNSRSRKDATREKHPTERAPLFTPFRGILLACALVGFLVVGYGTFSGESQQKSRSAVRIQNAPHKSSTPGGKSSPNYSALVKKENALRERRALAASEPFIPTMVRNEPELIAASNQDNEQSPRPSLPEPPMRYFPPEKSEQNSDVPTAVEVANRMKTRAKENRMDAMQEEMKSVLAAWDYQPHRVTVVESEQPKRIESPQIQSKSATSADDPSKQPTSQPSESDLPVAPGDLLFATNELQLNSDQPTPAMATVVSGELKGARLLGGFESNGTGLVIRFNRLRMPKSGVVHRIQSVAVDPELSRAAVASHVNNHTLERWGGLVAASFLDGLAGAIRDDGEVRVETVAEGAGLVVSERDFDSEERALVAVGKAGERLGDIMERRFDRPPTVKLEPGTNIGVLIL